MWFTNKFVSLVLEVKMMEEKYEVIMQLNQESEE